MGGVGWLRFSRSTEGSSPVGHVRPMMMILMMMINSQVDGICFDVLDLMNTTQRRWGSEHYGWVRKMQIKYKYKHNQKSDV